MVSGALLGYGYYYFIGCASGTCAISSSPVNASLFGMAIGYLAVLGTKTEKRVLK
ncbi:DUF6132 family protein [Planobacterium sp. JC490]|nr:DUF6132 family protein [Planobacterium sp. JC490]